MTKCSPLQKKNLFMLELSTMRLYLDNKRHYINMTYIFFFAFRWMTRNAECNMDPFTIPVHYQQILLPDPACSISELLKFPFPPQAWSSPSNGQYWSSNPPATANVDIDNLKSLTIPGQTSLQHINGTGLSALFTLRCHFNSILPPICWSSPWSFSVVGHDILGQGVSFLATCKGAMAACQALVDEEMECIPKTQKMMSLWRNIGCTSKLAMGWQCFWFHWGWTSDEASALTT